MTRTIVLAPDSFKESLTAKEVCEALEAGLRQSLPDATFVHVPMADGGEGTVQSLVDATGGELRTTTVDGPLGDPVQATWGVLGDGSTAVIEMAEASGIGRVPRDRRDPRRASTRGTGQLVTAALDAGITHIVLGIGGSATNDGGAGLAQALGARLVDGEGQCLGPGGAPLAQLAGIDVSGLDPRLAEVTVEVACDVTNPLCGPQGASAVYGPQKGADDACVAELDAALAHFAQVVARGCWPSCRTARCGRGSTSSWTTPACRRRCPVPRWWSPARGEWTPRPASARRRRVSPTSRPPRGYPLLR
ncbi:glycerate kinase [Luteococcus sp.]|uniref:glycerate kinase n=1 Tax=Luteococcus sp. TaxID=1969402 RepID=UPI002647FA21|nr:glycerate kinase [Luteococcus sp.]